MWQGASGNGSGSDSSSSGGGGGAEGRLPPGLPHVGEAGGIAYAVIAVSADAVLSITRRAAAPRLPFPSLPSSVSRANGDPTGQTEV